MKYTIKKIWQYTETVEVEAESDEDALLKSNTTEGDRNYDDHLEDAKIISRE